ncbi:MAG TPA: hypothetical protein VJU16_07945 [Planctomycetota bacterium]|nr:hypothetical protein [Planctomycetota bacterium]
MDRLPLNELPREDPLDGRYVDRPDDRPLGALDRKLDPLLDELRTVGRDPEDGTLRTARFDGDEIRGAEELKVATALPLVGTNARVAPRLADPFSVGLFTANPTVGHDDR